MKNVVLVLMSSLVLAACVAHEKVGDSAAAVGDWKTAYVSYRQALAEKPETPGLKEKHDQARVAAVAESWNKAQGCESMQQYDCARAETEFLLQLEPTHAEAIAMRQRAVTQQALVTVNSARAAAAQHRYQEAMSLLAKSRESNDPAVVQQTQLAEQEIIAGASMEADRLRGARQYDESIQLYELLAGMDGKYRDAVRVVSGEREQHLNALYEDQARRGDAALKSNDFRTAHAAYLEAEKVRPNGRAAPLVRYTATLISADEAITAKNWPAAETALRDAVATGKDDGRAAEMLDRVRLRTYKVSLRSVMLMPTRLDGSAWVGNTTPLFFRISQQMSQALQKNNFDRASQAAMDLPYENRPKVKVEVTLPDGMQLASPFREGVYAPFEGEFTIAANAFDERRIAFKVLLEKDNEEAGRAEVSLRDLFTKGDLNVGSQTIASVRLVSEGAEGRQPGTFVGLTRLDTPNATVAAPAPTAPGATGTAATPKPSSATQPAGGTTTGTTAPASGSTAPVATQPASTAPAADPAPAPAPRRSPKNRR